MLGFYFQMNFEPQPNIVPLSYMEDGTPPHLFVGNISTFLFEMKQFNFPLFCITNSCTSFLGNSFDPVA
jgi:hypothetical protein